MHGWIADEFSRSTVKNSLAVPADDPWDNPKVWPAWRSLLAHVLVAADADRTLTGVEQDGGCCVGRSRAGEIVNPGWSDCQGQLVEGSPDS